MSYCVTLVPFQHVSELYFLSSYHCMIIGYRLVYSYCNHLCCIHVRLLDIYNLPVPFYLCRAKRKIHVWNGNALFSSNIFYLLKYAKRIGHKLNKLMKSSPTYNKLQHYLIEHACICIFLTLICVN